MAEIKIEYRPITEIGVGDILMSIQHRIEIENIIINVQEKSVISFTVYDREDMKGVVEKRLYEDEFYEYLNEEHFLKYVEII